ncbi:MAG: CbbQ/NirQ/NorQ/GpvN family protein [Myxococcales bacterium]|nr:MAG: CbbQ/NirQ/NorQ/GpvN family protein [Myxococcales bacterium]
MLDAYRIHERPYYRAVGSELASFEAAGALGLPILLKGPTGCGKTRLVRHMAHRWGLPLVTVACNEDTTAQDLVGRFTLQGGDTRWVDGPLTLAARHGAVCYLDELVEAREDALVVVHPLSDDRRVLPLVAKSEVVSAHPDFKLVASYNPDYQASGSELKPSTRQRFAALALGYPPAEVEAEIVRYEAGASAALAEVLVQLALASRRLVGDGLVEGISTRMLVAAARLVAGGLSTAEACELCLLQPLTDDAAVLDSLRAALRACDP